MTKPTYEELQAQVERLRDEITAIMADSCGVAGYHYNGEIARWGEFSDLEEMLSETPTQSLAALKAQWQAEADQYEDGMPAQKAFWEGFERGSVGCNNLNIRAHWREYVGFKTGANK